jgi:hypothetical protein
MLEPLAARSDMINMRDEGFISLVRQDLHMNVHAFCFNPVEVHGVLERIRNRLLEKVNTLECCKDK